MRISLQDNDIAKLFFDENRTVQKKISVYR